VDGNTKAIAKKADQDDVDHLKGDVDGNTKGVAENSGKIAVNSGRIAVNSKNIAVNRKDININRRDINVNRRDIAHNRRDIDGNSNRIDNVESESRAGIALSLAMDVPYLLPSQNHALNLGAGRFHNATAVGITYRGAIYHDVKTNRAVSAYVGVGGDVGLKEVGMKVGVSFQW
jgi:hypothetical protein